MRLFLFFLLLATPLAAQNRLAGEASLYLQQHANNPVDWYPWGPEALKKAKEEDKLIFVSVGYAACHWCHVMEEESFENKAIADILNKNYISIKIDRERRPDLDEQFSLVTTLLTGSSGWPNSVFLTPEGDPFYAGTYFPPADFTKVLNTIVQVWAEDRPAVTAEAFGLANQMREYLDQTAVLGEISEQDFLQTARQLINGLDEFNGGFGDAPKFPREPELLFILDQALRSGDEDLLNAVTTTLDGILRGGIHDHVGGGFHRYAVDPEWQVPHFEKMLYDQALLGRLLVRGYHATGNPEYARAAKRTFDYVLREMRAPAGGFYAAQDADSLTASGESEEGAFYVWTAEEFTRVLGPQAAPLASLFDVSENGRFEGSNILHLQELPLVALAEAGISVATYDKALNTLHLAREKRPRPITDKKIILSWNGEMIATLAEASAVLDRPDYLQAAEKAADFILSNMQDAAGFKRIRFQGRADSAAQLPDYAAFGSALLALYDFSPTNNRHWLQQAQQVANRMQEKFADPGKAMRMTQTHGPLGPFRPLDDTEIASGNAQALHLLDGLDRRLARIGEAAPRLAASLAVDGLNRPASRGGLLHALAIQANGPIGTLRLSSGGAVRILARAERSKNRLTLTFRLAKGWHINAHKPLEDYLIGMELAANAIPAPLASYPPVEIKQLGFSTKPLALYENDFSQSFAYPPAANGPNKITLTLQACNDQVCLPPDDMVFRFW